MLTGTVTASDTGLNGESIDYSDYLDDDLVNYVCIGCELAYDDPYAEGSGQTIRISSAGWGERDEPNERNTPQVIMMISDTSTAFDSLHFQWHTVGNVTDYEYTIVLMKRPS